jgi:hypothetical protein
VTERSVGIPTRYNFLQHITSAWDMDRDYLGTYIHTHVDATAGFSVQCLGYAAIIHLHIYTDSAIAHASPGACLYMYSDIYMPRNRPHVSERCTVLAVFEMFSCDTIKIMAANLLLSSTHSRDSLITPSLQGRFFLHACILYCIYAPARSSWSKCWEGVWARGPARDCTDRHFSLDSPVCCRPYMAHTSLNHSFYYSLADSTRRLCLQLKLTRVRKDHSLVKGNLRNLSVRVVGQDCSDDAETRGGLHM